MFTMILKMSGITLLFILLTWFIWHTHKDKEINWKLRIIIGLVYGFTAILSTHFGVDYGDMVINVRDLGPMIAGLFFDPISGIIAGLIGGIERYIAGTFFNVGSFTRVACSISTCFAGVFAAFMHVYIFKRRKPSTAYAFFMGAVIEVFHMYVLFITHRDDMEMAFSVVKTCAMPMILFSALGLSACAEMVRYYSGEKRLNYLSAPSEQIPVSQRFQAWLFVVTMGVLGISFVLNYNLQSDSATQESRADLATEAADVQADYERLRQYNVDLYYLSNHVGSHGAYDIVDPSGKVVAGTHYGGGKNKILNDMYTGQKPDSCYSYYFEGENWMCLNTDLKDGYGLVTMLPESEVYQYRNLQAYETVLADILVFTVIYVLISLLVQMIVVDNLKLVNKSLAKITDGDFDEQVSVYYSSEFASLSDDINEMVLTLKRYIAAAEKRMEQDLLLAHTIQVSALPDNFDFQHGGFDIYATMDPAKEVGGDFYDFFFVGADKVAIVIADVSGKGIPAALFMMHSKTAIRGLGETGTEIVELFRRVNLELCEGNQAEMFVTVWMAIVDLNTGKTVCVNAGHEYPVLKKKGGDYKLIKDSHALPLGCMSDVLYYSYEIDLKPGDCLYVYTDGIPEAINADEEQFGTDRMLDVLNENKDASMTDLLAAVKAGVDKFVGEAEQFDDQTMVGFRYNGPQEG